MRLFSRVLAATAAAAAVGFTVVAPASAGVDPTLNHVSYWEQGGLYDCSKVELSDGVKTWEMQPGNGFYVFKAGTVVTVVDKSDVSGFYVSGKSISFVIECDWTYSQS